MRILITGANGFIGAQITATLNSMGHEIICAVRDIEQVKRRFSNLKFVQCDFSTDIDTYAWISRLANIDAVVNCVGVLQTPNTNTMNHIHYEAPRALIAACIQMQIKKFVHISALGIEQNIDIPYAQTKLNLEKYLSSLNEYNWIILRPSLVYGSGSYGGTSLFRALAAFPFITPMIGKGEQLFQPIHITELAKTVSIVLENASINQKIINVVGPEKIAVKDILIELRNWLGFGKAKIIYIPLGLIRILSILGNWFSDIPINKTSYKMLQYHNIADLKPFVEMIGFTPSGFVENLRKHPSSTQDRWHARLYFLNPLLRIVLGLVWILSGLIPLYKNGQMLYPLFEQVGVTRNIATLLVYGSAIWDISLGAATLANWRMKNIGIIQILTILFYTTAISVFLPEYWLDPLGSVLKNIPIIVSTLIMMVISDQR